MTTPPVVAIVNTNPDMVELLKAKIEQAGLIVLVMHVHDIRQGLDIENTLQQHDPRVVVYDVVAPYERSWRFLEHLRGNTAFKGRQFVLTSPNVAQVRRIVGSDEMVYEIVGGEEIDNIVQAVREASRARPTK
jgi:DNA-binding NarL/FixJ family response regulator